MPSPSTSTLRSGTVSRFSGGGALEKLSAFFGACCCCWNGANRSPPNQPPPPLRGCERDHPPKLKNCADAGLAIPARSATATASATSGPVSVNRRKKDFGFGIRSVAMRCSMTFILTESGLLRADFPAENRGNLRFTVTFRVQMPPSPAAQPLQHVGGGEPVRRGSDR